MPRYYHDALGDAGTAEVGCWDLPDLNSARRQAMLMVADLISELPALSTSLRLNVSDITNALVFTITVHVADFRTSDNRGLSKLDKTDALPVTTFLERAL